MRHVGRRWPAVGTPRVGRVGRRGRGLAAHDLHAVVDVVGDAEGRVQVVGAAAPLGKIDVEVVQRDGRVGPALTYKHATPITQLGIFDKFLI